MNHTLFVSKMTTAAAQKVVSVDVSGNNGRKLVFCCYGYTAGSATLECT